MSNVVNKVTFYPVSNGDSSQILLANGRRILMDFHHRACGEDESSPHLDLAKHLRAEFKAAGRDYVDVMAFTHADLDHICGFSDFFELQHSGTYQGGDRIKIKELWVPAAVLIEKATMDQKSDEFCILRQEARHRLKKGEGIKVFSKPLDVQKILTDAGISVASREHCFVDAGTIVDTFSLVNDGVEFFVHSPFVAHCEDGDFERNIASLIFNIRFVVGTYQCDYLAVGDTEYETLGQIVEITEAHNNSDRLKWDLFNIPHHCSYRALAQDKGDKETVPDEGVEKVLLGGKRRAYVVSSSRPIPNTKEAYEQAQPPHIQARNTYEKYLEKVGGSRMLVTMEYPNGFNPAPMVFEISTTGLKLVTSSSMASAGAAIVTAPAPRAG
jgi:hypothetical protein